MISFRKIRRGKNEKIKKRTPRVSGFSKSIGKGNWSEERKKKMYEWDTLMFRMVAV